MFIYLFLFFLNVERRLNQLPHIVFSWKKIVQRSGGRTYLLASFQKDLVKIQKM